MEELVRRQEFFLLKDEVLENLRVDWEDKDPIRAYLIHRNL